MFDKYSYLAQPDDRHGNVSILFQAASAPDLRRPSFFHPTHSSLLTRDLVDDFLNGKSIFTFHFCMSILKS